MKLPRPAHLAALLFALTILLAGARAATATAAAASAATPPPLLLISLDGFRADYCDLYPDETSHLRALRADGASAEALISVYPSNTFPNHYSIVTGLYPAHHGIINNDFFDPVRGEFFHYNRPAIASDGTWWGGEPIWVTAIKQGRRSACAFWPGSEAAIQGIRPTFWRAYDYSIPFEKRLDEMMGWLDVAPAQRPAVITFYLEETNSVGHRFGPHSPQIRTAIKLLDDRVGAIVDRLRQAGTAANVIVVSDHGMVECTPGQVVLLDDYFDLSHVQIDFSDTAAGLRPHPGTDADAIFARVSRMPHVRAYRGDAMPPKFHLRGNPRIPPIWLVPDEGWRILTRADDLKYQTHFDRGQHGYDPALSTMHALLIAHGPSFRRGARIPSVENIHLYNLMCAAAGLKPAANDGDDRLVQAFLR